MAETTSTQTDQEEKKRRKFAADDFFNPVEIFAYIVAGASTIVTTITSISTQFFKNLNEHKVFRDIWESRDAAYRKLYSTSQPRQDLIKGKKEIERTFHQNMNSRLEEVGIPTTKGPITYIKRTMAQYNTLKMHEKRQVFAKIGIVLGVGAGALWLMYNRNGGKKTTGQDKKAELTTKSPDIQQPNVDTKDKDVQNQNYPAKDPQTARASKPSASFQEGIRENLGYSGR